MTYKLTPGPSATPADLRAAKESRRLLAAELNTVRLAATAWRNGLGALLVGLLGFGLVKGRSDISGLATSWAAWVGVLLLAALIAGAAGALLLIRAASGWPTAVSASELRVPAIAGRNEARYGVTALRRGIVLTLTCAALLVAAVGMTWYGPGRSGPVLKVTTPGGTLCGGIIGASQGRVTLSTATGNATIGLGAISAVQVLGTCP